MALEEPLSNLEPWTESAGGQPNGVIRQEWYAWLTRLTKQIETEFARPNVLFVEDFGLVGDGITINSASVSISSGSAVLTVIGASFTPSDVGKVISVPGAGVAGATLHSSIISVTGVTQVTLANNASTTLSAVAKTITYGTDNTAAFKAFATVINTTMSARVEFPVNKKFVIWPGPDVPADDFLMEIINVKGLVINFNGSHFHSLFTTVGNRGWTIVLVTCIGVVINNYYHISDRGKGSGLDGGVVHIFPRVGTKHVFLNGFRAKGGNAGVLAFRNPGEASARSSFLYVDMEMEDVFYGINGFFDLDNVYGAIKTTNAGRSAFPNGNSKNWELTVTSTNPSGFGDVNIGSTFTEGLEDDLSLGMKFHYINHDSTIESNAWIYIGFLQSPGVTVTGRARTHAEISLDCKSPGNDQVAVVMQSFRRTGPGTQDIGEAPHIARVDISGRIINHMDDILRVGNSSDGWGDSAILNVTVRDLTTSSGNIKIGNGAGTNYTFVNVDGLGVAALVADGADPPLHSFNSYFAGVVRGIFLPGGSAIAFGAGDIDIKHSPDLLEFKGAASGYKFDTLLDISGATAGRIQFPAVQNPSGNPNVLDDYEEGTWVPTLTCGGVGDLSVAYAVRSATYTKIGRLTFVDWQIETSSFTHSTATGEIRVTGIPFTPAAPVAGGNVIVRNWTAAGFTILAPTVGSAPDRIVLTRSGSGQVPAISQISEWASGGTVILSGSMIYYT